VAFTCIALCRSSASASIQVELSAAFSSYHWSGSAITNSGKHAPFHRTILFLLEPVPLITNSIFASIQPSKSSTDAVDMSARWS
jgi:hypothetical protein